VYYIHTHTHHTGLVRWRSQKSSTGGCINL